MGSKGTGLKELLLDVNQLTGNTSCCFCVDFLKRLLDDSPSSFAVRGLSQQGHRPAEVSATRQPLTGNNSCYL
jgi:hypothetical protein